MLPGVSSVLIVIFCFASKVDLGIKLSISGKCDFDPMLPRAHEHGMSRATEFADGSGESVIHKDSGSLRRDLQLDLRCGFRKARPRVS